MPLIKGPPRIRESMSGRYSRRRLLRAAGATGVVGLAGCKENVVGGGVQTPTSGGGQGTGEGVPVNVRGAIYIPTRAFNIYQMWRGYDRAVVERDLGYASRLNLNAIRVWTSFEWWREDRKAHEKALDHLLSTAADEGLKVLVGLFDAVGAEATRENLEDTDLESATAVEEPSRNIVENESRWDEPRGYVRWFIDLYGADDRLLAIEAMNEPGWDLKQKAFARGMFKTMRQNRRSVPLTVGSTSLINCVDYAEWGSEVLQFHYNFPRNREVFQRLLSDAADISEKLDRPAWMSEWQRVRSSGGGFAGELEGDEWAPKYRTLAPALREIGVGSFFWSLMLKPAFTPRQRKLGAINGVFHEDGAVWSLEDAQAIASLSGESEFDGEERSDRPEWMEMEDIETEGSD